MPETELRKRYNYNASLSLILSLMEELIIACRNMDEESYRDWRKRVLDSTYEDSTDELEKIWKGIMEKIVEAVDKYTSHVSEMVLN